MKSHCGGAAGRPLPAALGLIVMSLALGACGSGASVSTSAPMNRAPAISAIGNQTVNQDTPAAMSFTVSDPEAGAAASEDVAVT